MSAKKRKIRAEFRKNRAGRTRTDDWTRRFVQDRAESDESPAAERISGKGELTRKRTIIATGDDELLALEVDDETCLRGRVLGVHGLLSHVAGEDGRLYRCATRRLLKTLSTDQRHVVATGDRVLIRPTNADEGLIVRVEPRYGVLNRTSRRRQHVICANVDQLLIVASAAEPYLKPNLIDRYLVTAERSGIRPIVCVNKVDLVDRASLMPLVGVYSQMGYQVLLTSATADFGIERLRRCLVDRATAVAGQSGVGKSSLLNAVEPGLGLRVETISSETQKGRHTTTTAKLLPLSCGGWVVDTPGIRQFQLWDVIPEEVAGFYRDLRPFVSHCRFPDCSHRHETDCAVKDAVADDLIDARRYESYVHLYEGTAE